MAMQIDGHDLLALARKGRPEVDYRLEVSGGSIAANVNGEWHRVACKALTGEWVEMGDLLINGQRMPFTPNLNV